MNWNEFLRSKKLKFGLFGLIILILVVIVFYVLALNFLDPFRQTTGSGPEYHLRQFREFKAECVSLCNNFTVSDDFHYAARYCAEKLAGDTDLNRNGKVDAFMSDTSILYVCEDGLYCFHFSKCNTDTGAIDWSDCRQILCNAYYDIYKNDEIANEKVKTIFANGIGSCDLPEGEKNWYDLYFGTNPCLGAAETTTSISTPASSAVLACIQINNSSVNCKWTCPNILSSQNPGVLSNDLRFESVQLAQSSGNYTFTGLTRGNTYYFGLVCDLPQSQIATSYSIKILS
jgi:hypothetical protein